MPKQGYAYRVRDAVDGAFALMPYPVRYRKAVDKTKGTVTSVLTYPVIDRAGDWVEPTGGDWSEHAAMPAIALEHDPEAVVAWARPTFADPGSPHSVMLKSLTIDGKVWQLPVGVSHFDLSDRLASQVFRLIDDDILPGVSIDFKAGPDRIENGKITKSFERIADHSPLDNRPAYLFKRWLGLGWSHCEIPVNPGTLTIGKSVRDTPMQRVLDTGRIGSEAAHPKILAIYGKLYGNPARRILALTADIPTRKKAMGDDEPTIYDGVADSEMPGDTATEADTGGTGTPTAEAGYQLSQGLTDIKTQIEDLLSKAEHMAGKKKLMGLLAKLESLAEEACTVAEKVDADVGGKGDGSMEPAEGDEPPDMEPDPEDDGMLKAIPATYRKSITRFRLKDLRRREGPADPVQQSRIEKKLNRLTRLAKQL